MSDQPYNSLGQILSQGGDIALGLAIAHGWTDTQIQTLFARRFEPMTEEDRVRLISIATNAVNAANSINELDSDESIPLGIIPVDEGLFGEESEGLRGFWVGEYSPDNGETWIQIRISAEDFGTKGDILDEIEDKGREIVSKYPDRLNRNGGDTETDGVARITFVKRRF